MSLHAEAPLLAYPGTEAVPQTYETRDWNENVLHVYPYTFNEERPENEDHRGMGSILGITDKLDWMQETGVTAIWLGPIYASPGLDGNYDISNYYEINPELGTMEDVDELIAGAHVRDIRVIFDLVPNHTSDKSEWFEASSNPDHPNHLEYRDYYYWRDPMEGELPEHIVGDDRLEGLPEGLTVPSNWSSIFSIPQIDKVRDQHGGSIPDGVDVPAVTAWAWHPKRQQLYLAEFMKEQPSLDWSNVAVREEIKKVVRFWLNKGVDSFRVDVVNHIGKDPTLQDEEHAPVGTAIGEYEAGVTNPHDRCKQERLVSCWPQLGAYASDLLSVLDDEAYQGRNIRFIFEDWISALTHDSRLNELQPDKANVFNFETLLNTDRKHWTAKNLGRIIQGHYGRMRELKDAAANQVTGNHDTDALRSRLGSAMTARAAHLMLAALPGSLYTWQGDMLGRPNVIVPKDRQRDGDIGQRDGERVPMQWDSSINGGFSRAEPGELWLPAVDAAVYQGDNIALQSRDPCSPYRLVQSILQRRKNDPALRHGDIRMLHTSHPDVLAFARDDPDNARRQVISITNFSQNSVLAAVHNAGQMRGALTLSAANGHERGAEMSFEEPLRLPPDASYILDSI